MILTYVILVELKYSKKIVRIVYRTGILLSSVELREKEKNQELYLIVKCSKYFFEIIYLNY